MRLCALYLLLMIGSRVAAEDAVRIYSKDVMIDELPSAMPEGSWDEAGGLGKLDWMKDWTFLEFQHGVVWVEDRFVNWFGDPGEVVPIPVSQFRLGLATRYEEDLGTEFGIDLDFDTDINLPNIERTLKLIITSQELGDLPGTDTLDRDEGVRAGLQAQILEAIQFDLGVRVRWLPEVYSRVGWRELYDIGPWILRPGISGYYQTGGEGFGANLDFMFQRWWGKTLFRSSNGLKWNQEIEEPEYAFNLVLGRAQELLDSAKYSRIARGEDLARGYGVRYSMNGEIRGGDVPITSHRFTLFYKVPLRKRWLFGGIKPEVRFREEADWDTEFLVTLGVDILFWGYGEDYAPWDSFQER